MLLTKYGKNANIRVFQAHNQVCPGKEIDGLLETMNILSNEQAMRSIRKSIKQATKGEWVDLGLIPTLTPRPFEGILLCMFWYT